MADDIGARATAAFATGMACSQAVASTLAERVGMDAETAAKAAAGFGGGMGRQALTCGAVTGGILILGLAHSEQSEAGWNKDTVYAKVQEFCTRFAACQGSTVCAELLGHDISDPAQMAQARDAGVFKTVCPAAVACAAELVEAMLPVSAG